MLSAQVEDLTEKIQKLEKENGSLIKQNSRLHKQLNLYRKEQSSVASAVRVGSSDSEPDITHLSIEENIVESYLKMKNNYDVLKEKCKKLAKFNVMLMQEKGELQKKLEDYCTQDSEDGNNRAMIEENAINQVSVLSDTLICTMVFHFVIMSHVCGFVSKERPVGQMFLVVFTKCFSFQHNKGKSKSAAFVKATRSFHS